MGGAPVSGPTALDPLCGGATLRVLVVHSSVHPKAPEVGVDPTLRLTHSWGLTREAVHFGLCQAEGVQRGVRMSGPLGPVWRGVSIPLPYSSLHRGNYVHFVPKLLF